MTSQEPTPQRHYNSFGLTPESARTQSQLFYSAFGGAPDAFGTSVLLEDLFDPNLRLVGNYYADTHIIPGAGDILATVSPPQELDPYIHLHTLGESKVLVCSEGVTVINHEQDLIRPETVSEYNIILGCGEPETQGLTKVGYSRKSLNTGQPSGRREGTFIEDDFKAFSQYHDPKDEKRPYDAQSWWRNCSHRPFYKPKADTRVSFYTGATPEARLFLYASSFPLSSHHINNPSFCRGTITATHWVNLEYTRLNGAPLSLVKSLVLLSDRACFTLSNFPLSFIEELKVSLDSWTHYTLDGDTFTSVDKTPWVTLDWKHAGEQGTVHTLPFYSKGYSPDKYSEGFSDPDPYESVTIARDTAPLERKYVTRTSPLIVDQLSKIVGKTSLSTYPWGTVLTVYTSPQPTCVVACREGISSRDIIGSFPTDRDKTVEEWSSFDSSALDFVDILINPPSDVDVSDRIPRDKLNWHAIFNPEGCSYSLEVWHDTVYAEGALPQGSVRPNDIPPAYVLPWFYHPDYLPYSYGYDRDSFHNIPERPYVVFIPGENVEGLARIVKYNIARIVVAGDFESLEELDTVIRLRRALIDTAYYTVQGEEVPEKLRRHYQDRGTEPKFSLITNIENPASYVTSLILAIRRFFGTDK